VPREPLARADVRPTTASDLETVLDLLGEAAAWIKAKGIRQWPARFAPEWVRPAIERGETFLATRDGTVVGTLTLCGDEIGAWDDRPGAAIYLHRLAVARAAAGLGRELLQWAESRAAAGGNEWLRLECLGTNERLRSYYEAAGYTLVADRMVGDRIPVAMYEKRVQPASGVDNLTEQA